MPIDYCLILAAGFGTRMGGIGKELPKVLWPVFERSLLELQVRYARSLGVEKIFINLHHQGEKIEMHGKGKDAFEGVTFLWEKPEILDIGGGVHNLARTVGYKGRLLVLNADQFFYLKKEELEKAAAPFAKSPVLLFNYFVNSDEGYNALEVDSTRSVKGLIKNPDLPRGKRIETYTGNALIDLASLEKVPGVSKFFDSVAAWDKRQVSAAILESDYWDFGTIQRYWDSCFRLLSTYRNNSNHPFLRFLVTERALKTWKINLQTGSYHSRTPGIINLGENEYTDQNAPAILLTEGAKPKGSNQVCWKEMSEELKK